MATMEDYLRAKIEEVEKSKREVEFELFRLKQNGQIDLQAEVDALKRECQDNITAANKHIGKQDTIIADLQQQLAGEKQYTSNLKSTIESLKQAGKTASKAASIKYQAGQETLQKMQRQLDEKSREVVRYRTEWKRSQFDCETLRNTLKAAGSKRKTDDSEQAPAKKKCAGACDDDSSGDEDDEEPLVNQWIRKTAVPTDGMAKIKLEKEQE